MSEKQIKVSLEFFEKMELFLEMSKYAAVNNIPIRGSVLNLLYSLLDEIELKNKKIRERNFYQKARYSDSQHERESYLRAYKNSVNNVKSKYDI